MTDLALLRLLQLVSPGLPIGMYSYSQGMETAVEDGLITDASETREWIKGILLTCQVYVDLPLASRLYDAWLNNDLTEVASLSSTLLACRETSELRVEDQQTGQALARLLDEMQMTEVSDWKRNPDTTLATLFTCAAVKWTISKQAALTGYLWSWLENQIICAIKLVPLGQVAGQQLLYELATSLPECVEKGLQITDVEIGSSAFGLALASSRHETQYTRLFRS